MVNCDMFCSDDSGKQREQIQVCDKTQNKMGVGGWGWNEVSRAEGNVSVRH